MFTVSGSDVVLLDASDSIDNHVSNFDSRDNRFLVDSSFNQTLKMEEIEKLKSSGLCGHDLLEAFAKHSASFDSKTKFSQDKYLAKKRKRHLMYFSIQPASSRFLCEMYGKIVFTTFFNVFTKLLNLRRTITCCLSHLLCADPYLLMLNN
ncbi:unnamed protein product [Protopolystoma xenopodis]|uniref:tRNA (adenine(58)-N(1))-methyltransferase non-catalytic subunit TRM6 n=1 Tax=Protopolystoma xenopodis TaxID=117903 RepID=A0A448W9Q5_9PLAT|nr:unnamed protein product [Protopolystoma xenopodis]